jgi:crotonobetainyl-CoA:carnitine CoA-transferase CaiB-like acyl-CoA transferase
MKSNEFLDDIKILDLSQYIPGPFATRQLCDLGAQVIKVEPPGGDPMRRFMYAGDSETSPVYQHLNRGKRICCLDLKSSTGQQALGQLLEGADVLLESFRPGVLQRLGFERTTLNSINPQLIHCALSGYGQTGPYIHRAGHDLNYCAASGALGISGTGKGPSIAYPPLADHAGAMQASVCILAALHARQRTGEGAYIDVSLFESCLSWQYLPFFEADNAHSELLLNGGAACYNIYQCSDGHFISLAALEKHFWQNFCAAVAKPEWAESQYDEMPQKQLIAQVAELFKGQALSHWSQVFDSIDCCYEPLLFGGKMSSHPQIKARRALSRDGPAYPAHINNSSVALGPGIFEFKAEEQPRWINLEK